MPMLLSLAVASYACICVVCERLDDELWVRPVKVVQRFLKKLRLQKPSHRTCELPVIDTTQQLSSSHGKLLTGGAHLLTGFKTKWLEASRLGREPFVRMYGKYKVRSTSKRTDPHDYAPITSQTVEEFVRSVSLSNLSIVATAYKTQLENELLRKIMQDLPSEFADFDLKPVLQLAATLGSGTAVHSHIETWFLLLQGLKAWWVGPAMYMPLSVQHEMHEHTAHPCSWLEKSPPKGMRFCLQQPGDVIYLADKQVHATCNLEEFVLGVGAHGRLPANWTSLERSLHRGQTDLVKDFAHGYGRNALFTPSTENVSITEGSAPLHKAAQSNFTDLVHYLLEEGAEVQQSHPPAHLQPLHHAAFAGHLSIVSLLLLQRADLHATSAKSMKDSLLQFKGVQPLHLAIRGGDQSVMEYLVAARANIHMEDGLGDLPLHYAAYYGHVTFADQLLRLGADAEAVSPNGGGFRAIHSAAMSGHHRMVELLINHGAHKESRTDDGRVPLHVGAMNGHRAVVRILVRSSAHLDTADYFGRQAVHFASSKGHMDIVQLVIGRHSLGVRAKTQDGATALHAAAHGGHLSMAKSLLKLRADVRVTTIYGTQPLHTAAQYGHSAMIKLLLQVRAQLQPKDADGREPLHLAASSGHSSVLLTLLGFGLQVRPADVAFAERHGSPKVVQYLRAMLAKSGQSRVVATKREL